MKPELAPGATAHDRPVGLGSPLHVEIRGSGSALVMLHGGGGGIDDLAELRERIGAGRRVISPDQRGHGRSTGDGEISYAAQAADTAGLLDELGVQKADVLGWSDGGIVGLLLARDRPDLVGRLVAISANAALTSEPPAVVTRVTEWIAKAHAGDLSMPNGRDALPKAGAEWPEVAERILAMWRHGPDIEIEDLARITAPVLYLAADADIVPLEHTVAMVRATPGARLAIVPDADHHLVLKRVDEVAAIVQRFLAG